MYSRINGELDPIAASIVKNVSQTIVANLTSDRMYGRTSSGDRRRNIEKECGLPEDNPSADFYQRLWERMSVANRVVSVYPRECWQTSPTVYEDEDEENVTEFEEAWDNLSQSLRGGSFFQDEEGSPVWEYLQRADELSGIGHFGVVLLGFDDKLDLSFPVAGVVEQTTKTPDTPMVKEERDNLLSKATTEQEKRAIQNMWMATNKVATVEEMTEPSQSLGSESQYFGWYGAGETPATKPSGKKTKLLYMKVFPEYLIQVVRYEANIRNPRFGQPVMYRITLNDPRQQTGGIGLPLASIYVHWSRVVHIADNRQTSDCHGTPRMRPVLDNILSLKKLYGASPEGYWQSCFAGLSFETHPQLGGDVIIDAEDLKDQVENYANSLQRYLLTSGMAVKPIAPSVADPTPHINLQIEAICIQLGIPIRVFKGSERGELASSQDDAAWNDRLKQRRNGYITPWIIVPLVDRLILVGVLPAPKAKAEEIVQEEVAQGSIVEKKVDFATNRIVYNIYRLTKTRHITANFPFNKPKGDAPPTGGQDGAIPPPGGPPQEQGPKFNPYPPRAKAPDRVVSEVGYSVEWQDLESSGKSEKATIANTFAQAISAYIQSGADVLVPPQVFLTKIIGFDEEEARAIVEAGEQIKEDKLAEQQAMAEEQGFIPEAPEGMIDPEQRDMEHEVEMERAKSGNPPPFGGPPKSSIGKPPFPPQVENTENAFCPIGPGGGVDASCSPGGGDGALSQVKELKTKFTKTGEISDEEMSAGIDKIAAGLNAKEVKELASQFGASSAKGRANQIEGIKTALREIKSMGSIFKAASATAKEYLQNEWVALPSGQHVFLGEGGEVLPSGPDSKSSESSSKGGEKSKKDEESVKAPDPVPAKQLGGDEMKELEQGAFKYLNKLPPKVRESVREYTDKLYEDLNANMRSCPPDFGCVEGQKKEHLERIEKAIEGHPPFKTPVLVSRRIKLEDADRQTFEAAFKNAVSSGTPIQLPSLTSTTMTKDILGGNVRITIAARHGLPVGAISDFPDEREILMSSRARYRVAEVRRDEKSNDTHIHLEQVL